MNQPVFLVTGLGSVFGSSGRFQWAGRRLVGLIFPRLFAGARTRVIVHNDAALARSELANIAQMFVERALQR